MPTLVHLSDLHFGSAYVPRLGELILEEIATLKPDVIVVSGDFTMRARHREYAQARDYLDRITTPLLTIPGNHDQPLFAPVERLLHPMARYEKYIHASTDATLNAHGWFVLGVNDNRPILPGGFWSRTQRAWIERELANAPRETLKVFTTHHQLDWAGKRKPAGVWFPTREGQFLARQGVELVLNGHTHVPGATQTPEGMVIARAGTATSNRTRHGNTNSYNFITCDEKSINVFVRRYDEHADAFGNERAFTFKRKSVIRNS